MHVSGEPHTPVFDESESGAQNQNPYRTISRTNPERGKKQTGITYFRKRTSSCAVCEPSSDMHFFPSPLSKTYLLRGTPPPVQPRNVTLAPHSAESLRLLATQRGGHSCTQPTPLPLHSLFTQWLPSPPSAPRSWPAPPASPAAACSAPPPTAPATPPCAPPGCRAPPPPPTSTAPCPGASLLFKSNGPRTI